MSNLERQVELDEQRTLKEEIIEFAEKNFVDLIGFASRDRFEDLDSRYNPLSIFPEANTIILLGRRITRGTLRGIEEGTNFGDYGSFGYRWLDDEFVAQSCYDVVRFIEDKGWEAVPVFPNPKQVYGQGIPVKEGNPAPNVAPDFFYAAVACGLGEIGFNDEILTKKYGPRQRFQMIITDAVIEPDPIIEPGTICNKCGRCVKECPGNAIPPVKDKDKKITIKVGDKDITWGDVDMGRCTLTHHGFNNKISPFHKKAFPNLEFDAANAEVTEEEAYRLCYPLAVAKWTKNIYDDFNGAVIDYYNYIMFHVGYFAVCGARGCIRACMDNLEENNRITNTFKNEFYKKESWILPNKKGEKKGKINPFREEYLDENYPGIRENEY